MLSCLFPPPFFPCAAAPSCLFVCMHVLLTVHSVTMAGSGMEEGKEFLLHFSRHFPTEPYKGEIDEGCGCKKGTKRPSLFFLDFQERCMRDGCSLRDLAAGKPAQEKTICTRRGSKCSRLLSRAHAELVKSFLPTSSGTCRRTSKQGWMKAESPCSRRFIKIRPPLI